MKTGGRPGKARTEHSVDENLTTIKVHHIAFVRNGEALDLLRQPVSVSVEVAGSLTAGDNPHRNRMTPFVQHPCDRQSVSPIVAGAADDTDLASSLEPQGEPLNKRTRCALHQI